MPQRRQVVVTALLASLATWTALVPRAQAWGVVSVGSGPAINGSGRLVDQARQVAPFTRLLVDGPFDVQARPGGGATVNVRADDNLQALLSTTVEGDTLVVKTLPGASFRSRHPLQVTVGYSSLRSAELRGSGDLDVTGLKTERFEVVLSGSGDVRLRQMDLGQFQARLAGSGDITAQGRSTETTIALAGSGDVHAAELLSQHTRVSVAGSGDASVHASESLDAQVAGSGNIRYAGQPAKLVRRVSGSGEVRPLR